MTPSVTPIPLTRTCRVDAPPSPVGSRCSTWAYVTLADHSGRCWVLQIHSEYGSWSYGWHAEKGRTFAQLLCEADQEYLVRKLCKGARTHFDLEATLKQIERWIAEMLANATPVWGRSPQLPKRPFGEADATEARQDLAEIAASGECERSPALFAERCLDSPGLRWLYPQYAADGICVMRHDPACVEMLALVWPVFVEHLKEEVKQG